MTLEEYDAWYDTPRGRWIGEREWALVDQALAVQAADSVLDVGCGTGWFTRQAQTRARQVVGLDIDGDALALARRRSAELAGIARAAEARFVLGDAVRLPFADRSFDKVLSITALCFVPAWPQALAEIVRVCRDRFAIGLLNRHSWLHRRKGRGGGVGAYAGAHWHTATEVNAALRRLALPHCRIRYAIFDPSGSPAARALEALVPASCPLGGFMLVAGRRA